MATICNCESGIINSGLPNCVDGFGRIVKLFFAYQYANDGTRNVLDCALMESNPDYVIEKINELDKSKRWYPSDLIYQVVSERGDPITETIDNTNRIITQGPKTFTGLFVDKGSNSPQYLKFLQSLECPKLQYVGIDEYGNLVGDSSIGGDVLTGFDIQSQSLYTKYVDKTATTTAKNQITFTLSDLVKDANISYIPEASIPSNMLTVGGLLDVVLASTLISPTFESVELTGSLVYGNVCKKLPFTAGDLVADWYVFNVTTSAVVTVTSVAVIETGKYELNFIAQTVGDLLNIKLAKDGFESNTLAVTFV